MKSIWIPEIAFAEQDLAVEIIGKDAHRSYVLCLIDEWTDYWPQLLIGTAIATVMAFL